MHIIPENNIYALPTDQDGYVYIKSIALRGGFLLLIAAANRVFKSDLCLIAKRFGNA